jgi:alkanesulfonate monooxygenase SsuD/methylene tetrahydromethanopterin reductase-like flavin-dependent oxidoreductase (luciferase family)
MLVVMKYGLDVGTVGDWSDIRRLTELAVEAESAGWDGFFLWDILMPDDDSPVADPWVALASIAAATNTITLGVMVTPLPRRQPWDVARQLASLDHLSGGRMIFAAGLGNSAREFERLGLSADPRLRAERWMRASS